MLPVGRYAVRPSRSKEPMPPFASARSTRSPQHADDELQRPPANPRARSAARGCRVPLAVGVPFSSSAFRAVCA